MEVAAAEASSPVSSKEVPSSCRSSSVMEEDQDARRKRTRSRVLVEADDVPETTPVIGGGIAVPPFSAASPSLVPGVEPASSAAAALIEDEDEQDAEQQEPSNLDVQRPQAQTPRQMMGDQKKKKKSEKKLAAGGATARQQPPPPPKASTAIPKEHVESFYGEAHKDGIMGMEVHVAAAEAQLWQKKWATCSDETQSLHGYVESQYAQTKKKKKSSSSSSDDKVPSDTTLAAEEQPESQEHKADGSSYQPLVLDHYAFHWEDMLPPGVTLKDLERARMLGARNPSPESMLVEDEGSLGPIPEEEEEIDDDDVSFDEEEVDDDDEEENVDDILLWVAKMQEKDRRRKNLKRRQTSKRTRTSSALAVDGRNSTTKSGEASPGRQEPLQAPSPAPQLVRPIAVRITRPAAALSFAAPANASDIFGQDRASTSPLTTYSEKESFEEESDVVDYDGDIDDDEDSSFEGMQPNNKRRNVMSRQSSMSTLVADDGDDEGNVIKNPDHHDSPQVDVTTPTVADIRDDLQTQQVVGSVVNVVEAECDEIEETKSELCLEEEGPVDEEVAQARDGLLEALAASAGDTDSVEFNDCLEVLEDSYSRSVKDIRHMPHDAGLWLTLTKPTFFGQVGNNDADDPMYTLGRMAFDMFSPTNLVVSLQGNFNVVESCVEPADAQFVPKALLEEVQLKPHLLRTYNIVAAFTIEPPIAKYPDAPNKDVSRPIRGIMTTYGFTLPDPSTRNRQSVWITGGRIEPNSDIEDLEGWKRLFTLHPPKHTFGQKAKLLAVKWLMGANTDKCQYMSEDGSLEYTFTRPLGGHGTAYVDTIYVDSSLRVVRGHRGTTFVFTKLTDGGNAAHDLAHAK